MATRIPPPKPGTPVPKEYVRQQLKTLGIRNVTEEELEVYAAGKRWLGYFLEKTTTLCLSRGVQAL